MKIVKYESSYFVSSHTCRSRVRSTLKQYLTVLDSWRSGETGDFYYIAPRFSRDSILLSFLNYIFGSSSEYRWTCCWFPEQVYSQFENANDSVRYQKIWTLRKNSYFTENFGLYEKIHTLPKYSYLTENFEHQMHRCHNKKYLQNVRSKVYEFPLAFDAWPSQCTLLARPSNLLYALRLAVWKWFLHQWLG